MSTITARATSNLVHRTLLATLLAAATGGCTDDTAGMPDDPGEDVDTTAPSVSTTQPAANATGVLADDQIVVTFSEAMDAASVEAAYSSTDLPADQVSFSWNAAATVLTITPSAPLEYATGLGTDPSTVTRKSYAIAIGATATDAAGNPLEAPLALSFETKRRMLASFPIVADMTRVLRDTTLLSTANPMWMGDNSTGQTYRSYLTFDLATLPAGAAVEAAEFRGQQTAPSGAPYSLGAIKTEHVVYPAMIDANTATALSNPGAFSSDATLNYKRLDVSAEVQDDVANRAARNNRAQFRLRFDQDTNGNAIVDVAVFDKSTFSLAALFLVD